MPLKLRKALREYLVAMKEEIHSYALHTFRRNIYNGDSVLELNSFQMAVQILKSLTIEMPEY